MISYLSVAMSLVSATPTTFTGGNEVIIEQIKALRVSNGLPAMPETSPNRRNVLDKRDCREDCFSYWCSGTNDIDGSMIGW